MAPSDHARQSSRERISELLREIADECEDLDPEDTLHTGEYRAVTASSADRMLHPKVAKAR